MKSKINNNQGFTLVELLVVIAIVASLAAISIPIGTRILNKGYETEADSTMKSIIAAVSDYESDYFSVASGFSTIPGGNGTGADDGGDGLTSSAAAPANAAAAIAQNDFDDWFAAITGDSRTGNRRGKPYLKLDDCKNPDTNRLRGGITRANGGSAHGLVDPWGNSYYIQLDLDKSHSVKISAKAGAHSGEDRNLGSGLVAIISGGRDGDFSTKENNVTSW